MKKLLLILLLVGVGLLLAKQAGILKIQVSAS
jgi:hypothetical protein